MTAELLSGIGHPLLGRSPFEAMPDSAEEHWRQHYSNYNSMQFLTSQWPQNQAPPMGTLPGVDVSIIGHDHHQYMSILPPGMNIGYSPNMESDTVHTPSDMDYSHDHGGSFQHTTHDGYLEPPRRSQHGSNSGGSPREPSNPGRQPERPDTLRRTVTAPTPEGHRKSTAGNRNSAVIKRDGTSDEDDAEYVPEDNKTRKKRTRIPHTAVERRYRENLNAHLEKLRQAVPALASRRGPGGGKADGNEGVKPSKCEILNGAIEHIAALDKANAELGNEVQTLRVQIREMGLKIEKMDNWYRANGR